MLTISFYVIYITLTQIRMASYRFVIRILNEVCYIMFLERNIQDVMVYESNEGTSSKWGIKS